MVTFSPYGLAALSPFRSAAGAEFRFSVQRFELAGGAEPTLRCQAYQPVPARESPCSSYKDRRSRSGGVKGSRAPRGAEGALDTSTP